MSKSFEEKKVFRTDGGGDNVILVEDQDDFATWELFVKWAYTGNDSSLVLIESVTDMRLQVLLKRLRPDSLPESSLARLN